MHNNLQALRVRKQRVTGGTPLTELQQQAESASERLLLAKLQEAGRIMEEQESVSLVQQCYCNGGCGSWQSVVWCAWRNMHRQQAVSLHRVACLVHKMLEPALAVPGLHGSDVTHGYMVHDADSPLGLFLLWASCRDMDCTSCMRVSVNSTAEY